MLHCPQLQLVWILQNDVGLVFVRVHIACKCLWFNDVQVKQIMCKLLKVFQVCFNICDSSLCENISVEYVFWTRDKKLR